MWVNSRQKTNWEAKREAVYKTSLTKFIKSLYNNSLQNDGFVLADIRLNDDQPNPFNLTMLTQEDILSTVASDNSKTLDLSKHQILLICYGRPVTDDDLARLDRAQYPDERFNSDFSTGLGSSRTVITRSQQVEKLDNHGLYRNLLHGASIRIFPDGTYTNKILMAPVNSSETLLGLSIKLPLEYIPEGSMSSGTDTEAVAEDTHRWSDNIFADVDRRFKEQLNLFPQEKIHLHTDRDVYVSGEKILFKAYITDALTHQSHTNSRYVYVELISPADTLMYRVMVRPVDGMFYGYLPLTDYVPTGNYTLRAYTRYMENLGDDYFFKKNIRIENLSSAITQQRPTANRGMLKDDFTVSFFPEGGNLPEGVLSKVALKALNINGYPEKITGVLIDENGVAITLVETFYAGMGVFEYKAEAGKRIYLKCKNVKGIEKQFELPQSNIQAYTLTATRRESDFLIEIRHSAHAPDIHCYLLAHCRGEILYFAEWDKEKEGILFAEEELPAGIIQFVLFDEQMNPLSERLVFSKNYDEAKVEFHTDKEVYEKREKVITTLNLSPSPSESAGEGLFLSVSITDDKDIPVDSSTTILSTLLLSSELRGYIENPAWYLQENASSVIALDYLMLTHGWRRYAIPEVVKGNPVYPQIPYQVSQQISGHLKSLIRSRPVTDSEITILMPDGNFGITSSDAQGTFTFQDFEYPDSTFFLLQALSGRGSSQIELVVDDEPFPKLIHAPQSPLLELPVIREETKNESESDAFITKAEQRARYDEDMWVIHLSEVEITARRIEKKDEPRLQYWANSASDVTIRREDFEKSASLRTTDLLGRIPGIRVFNNGSVSIRAGGNPLIVIDGVYVEWPPPGPQRTLENSPLELVNIHDIESIDVFKGPSTAAFGSRGADGVIVITTIKSEEDMNNTREKFNYTLYSPLGYQMPVEFYSPQYETLENKQLSIPDYRTTIFWKPNIVISNEEEETSFEFYTSDFPTTYSVVIEGLTDDGRIVRQVEKIRVE